MAKKNRTANEETQEQESNTQEAEAPKQVAKEDVATYNQEEAEIVKLKTPKGTQLYHPVTRTLYNANEAEEGSLSDQFIATNLKNGKLKKA